MPPATKAMLQLLGGLLARIVQPLPEAKREKIDKAINEIVEAVVEPAKPEQRTESARRQANKKANPTNTKHYSGYKNPLVLTAAEKGEPKNSNGPMSQKGQNNQFLLKRHRRSPPATVSTPLLHY